jgi:hypothetical protein
VSYDSIPSEQLELLMLSERLEAAKSRSLLSAVIWGFFAIVSSVLWIFTLPALSRRPLMIVLSTLVLAAGIAQTVRYALMSRTAVLALRLCEETLRSAPQGQAPSSPVTARTSDAHPEPLLRRVPNNGIERTPSALD